jgi:hypothetical protein
MSTKRLSVVARVTGLAVIGLLQVYWLLQPIPLNLKLLIAGMVAVSLVRPMYGLLIFAGTAPVSTAVALACGAYGLGGRMLEQLALGIGAGVVLHMKPAEGRTRIGRPAWFVALVALASAATLVPAAAAPIMRYLGDGHALIQEFVDFRAAQSSTIWAPVFAAAMVAACGLLGWATERTVRRTPGLAGRLVMMGLIGTACAAALSLQRLVVAAARGDDTVHSLVRLLLTVRWSLQTDVNASASALILAGIAGAGLIGGPLARRIAVGGLVALAAVGAWITGSRIALAMVLAAAFAALLWRTVRAGRGRAVLVAGAGVLVIGAGAWLIVANPFGRNGGIGYSVDFRRVMLEAGIKMFEKAPVFGVGVHRFYDESYGYAGDALAALGWARRENAHNNFMQVLAEEGVVGFAAMIWWLAAILVAGARAQLAKPEALRGGLLLAVVAAMGTWLTGHPLLVPEFAFLFWLYCGVLAGTTAAPSPGRAGWIPSVLTAALLASVPLRAVALRNAADLEHRGFGLSELWLRDDTQRYREAGSAFAIFLGATGRPVDVPVRRAPGASALVAIEVRIGGRLLERIQITGDEWRKIPIVVPAGWRRFEAVDFVVRDAASGADVTGVALRVGLDTVR